uniref:Uncharacterized protein n=1 Tax=Myoviridae sp. ctBoB21 TaxID=2827287 RepID=A0A8S5R6D8_9CAUD|nr:MAG TPA: hypothetical protein [Myoviridae sp. ctBoB21]
MSFIFRIVSIIFYPWIIFQYLIVVCRVATT